MTKLNPGIRRTVAWLNQLGFRTCDSGDGETHDFECDRQDPYVVIQIDNPLELSLEADRLAAILEDRGIPVRSVSPDDSDCVQIQASYDPINRYAMIDVNGISDRMLPDPIPKPRHHPPLPPAIAAANLDRLRGGNARAEDCELVPDYNEPALPES